MFLTWVKARPQHRELRILFYDLASTGLLLRLWASELEIGGSSVPTSVKSALIFTNFSASHLRKMYPCLVPCSVVVFFLSLNLAYQTSCQQWVARVAVAPLAPRLLWRKGESSKHQFCYHFYCDELSFFSWLDANEIFQVRDSLPNRRSIRLSLEAKPFRSLFFSFLTFCPYQGKNLFRYTMKQHF